MNEPDSRRFLWRRELVALLEFVALTGFAVAQPVFNVLSGATDYLVFRRVDKSQIVALAVVLVVVPPVALWLVEAVGRLVYPPAGRHIHAVVVAGLLTVFALHLLRPVGAFGARGRLLTALALGVSLGAVCVHWRPAQLWMRAASPAPVVFAALFLFATPVAGLLQPSTSAPVRASPVDGAPPVVLMVFDEFPVQTLLGPGGEIDGRVFPNFRALASEATFFRNTTTVAARTMHALPSLLTGQFPRRDAAPTSAQYPDNLFTLLQGSHRVHAFESVAALCPASACPAEKRGGARWSLLHDALRVWAHAVAPGAPRDDPLGNWFWEELDETAGRPARFDRFLESIDGEGTTFHFLHVLLPHAPWRYLPDGSQYSPRELGLVSYDERTGEAWPALVDHQRHVLQAMYVDTLLGQTVTRLREVGLYERAAIVVTADHGISFQAGLPQGTRNVRPENEHEIAWVPLLLKAPGQTVGAVRDDNVMTVDVTPTIADLAGIATPWELDGVSLVSAAPRGPGKVLFNQPGAAIHLDGDAAFGRVLAGAAEDLARPDEGAAGMYMVGPFRGHVGVAPASFDLVEEPASTGRVEDLRAYDNVNLDAGTVPALVAGYLDLPDGAGTPAGVAIVVNGTVAAVSGVYAEGPHAYRFAAMVWPGWMQQGANSLELYLVDEGDPPRFRRISVTEA